MPELVRSTRRTRKPRADRKRVYNSKRWRLTRRAVLDRHPICQRCKADLATDVHHRTDLRNGGDPYGFDNLEALCRPCHSRHHCGEGEGP